MRFKFKYLTALVVLTAIGSIIYGFTVLEEEPVLANKCIGFGTAGLFLLAMPMFLIVESRGKKVKDYMFTEENIRKMQSKDTKKTGNQ